MTNPLVSFSEQLATTVEQAGQSVVSIDSGGRFNSSGIHWTPGLIVTADHAIRHDENIHVAAPNGVALEAELVGRDPTTDLAVLRVKDLDLPVANRAETVEHKPGSAILAVGRFKDSVTAAFGIVSSVSGPSQTWRGGHLDQVVRLDIALHPAAAGGSIVDASGRLTGLATPALSRISVFAIPVSTLSRVIDKLLAHGRIPRGYLGVGLQPIALPEHLKKELNLQGSSRLIAISVDDDSPAGRAGLVIGDVVLELGGRPAYQPEDVQAVLDAESIGKKVTARILRGGQAKDVDITVGERPRRA